MKRMGFAKRLKYLLEIKDIKQKELAGVIGKEISTVSNYIQGTTKPSFDTLIQIADFLEVPLDDLVDRQIESKEKIDFSQEDVAYQEEEFIALYRSLPKKKQKLVLEIVKAFNQNTK